MACTCRSRIDEQLESRNMQLVPVWNMEGGPAPVVLATEKVDTKKRGKTPVLYATFCPFCGDKYDDKFVPPEAGDETLYLSPGNYYGQLAIKHDSEGHWWSVENYSGHHWEPIPPALYRALRKQAMAEREAYEREQAESGGEA